MALGLAYALSHTDFPPIRLTEWFKVPACPGVYCLSQGDNHKLYVGQSGNLRRRMRSHRYSHKSSTIPISSAINKHGAGSFTVMILAVADGTPWLDEVEALWIADLETQSSGYNVFPCAPTHHEYEITPAARERMSENHADVSGENNPFYGKKHKPETRRRMRKPRTPEGRASIAKSNARTKGRPVEKVCAITGKVIETYPSAREAARQTGISQPSMNRRVNGKTESDLDGYHYRYVGDK